MLKNKELLIVYELGGYPDFSDLYKSLNYTVQIQRSVRQAIRSIKKSVPAVIVAEFNFQSDFRDRTSSLESLLSSVQQYDGIDIIVFYEEEYLHQFEKLQKQYTFTAILPFPIDESSLRKVISEI